jgi:hypothetical protein
VADGIRINDASVEISTGQLEALVKKQGAAVSVTKLDLSVTPEALATLLSAFAPEGTPPPAVELSEGRMLITGEREAKSLGLDLRLGGLRVEITAEGLHLVSEGGG